MPNEKHIRSTLGATGLLEEIMHDIGPDLIDDIRELQQGAKRRGHKIPARGQRGLARVYRLAARCLEVKPQPNLGSGNENGPSVA